MSSRDFLKDRREALEEEFFHKLQEQQLAALRTELDRKATREELRTSCGIADDAVLDQLVALGVSGSTMAALSMVPLVSVAWADGEVQDRERTAVLKAAHERGVDEKGPAHSLLAGWLARRPSPQLFDAWASYTRALAATLVPSQRVQLRQQIAGMARKVAESAGGFLGLGKIGQQEEATLAAIAAVFDDPTAP
ncbi:MAG TPA: hypothetical protein VK698_28995 [Kofleriaceae bacterium]|nr:hypothetical protein [Kofleriaceae bacterium]